MPALNLKPTHKPVKSYYVALDHSPNSALPQETAVRAAFQSILEHCAWTLVPEHAISTRCDKRIVVDGA